jgi:gas vesicle protein
MSRRERRKLRDFAWLAAGIGIGSAVSLLTAPYTGEEVRFALNRGYSRTAKRIGRHTEDLRERAEDLLKHAQDVGERAQDLGKHGWKLLRRFRAA